MTVKRATLDQLKSVAEDLNMPLTDARPAEFPAFMHGSFDAYDVTEAVPDFKPVVKYPTTAAQSPAGQENKYNARYDTKITKGSAGGRKSGRIARLIF